MSDIIWATTSNSVSSTATSDKKNDFASLGQKLIRLKQKQV